MAEQTNGANGKTDGAGPPQAPTQVQVVAQYIKDLSFENPNVNRLMQGPGEAPNLKLEVNVNAQRMGEDLFESAIDFKAHATNARGVIYNLEMVYAGLFRLRNFPEPALEPFLLVNCPSLLFPFLRRIAIDLSRESGFPPLPLDPIDFGGLFVRRKQEQAASAAAAENPKG